MAISSRTIRRHFDKPRIDYGHFGAKYLKHGQGITGIIPADLKFRHLFSLFCKNYENRTMGILDISI